MPAVTKTFHCEDCGTPTTRKRRADQSMVCITCGVQRGMRNSMRLYEEGQARRQARHQASHGGNE